MSLRRLQSLGVNCLDVQADVSAATKKKSDSSILVILPGRLHQPNNTEDNTMKEKHIQIGRIDGFHNTDQTSPNFNHLTLSLGGTSCRGSNNEIASTTVFNVAASNSNRAKGEDLMNVSTTAPTIRFRGRSMPTTTTFVLLHVVTGGNTTAPSTGTTTHKKSTKVIKPKVICKGVYNNVVVFGKGEQLLQEEVHATTTVPTTSSSIADPIINVTPPVPTSHYHDSDGVPPDHPPISKTSSRDIHNHTTQPLINEGSHGSEDGKLPEIERSTNVNLKSPPQEAAKRPTTRMTTSQLPSASPHPVRRKIEQEFSPSLSSQLEKQNPHIEIQSKSNQHHESSVNNAIIATSAASAYNVTTHTISSKRGNQQQGRDHDQRIDSSPNNENLATTMSMTCPQTPDSMVTDQVLPEATTSSLQKQPLVAKATITSSSRKRRRCRNTAATNKKIIYTLDTDDDDEFAFMGG